MADEQYESGRCNIGDAEIRRRRLLGSISAITTAAFYASLVVVGATPETRLLVGIPAFAMCIGLLQARHRFCVRLGMEGVYNFSEAGRKTSIHDPQARHRDHIRSVVLSLQALFGGAVSALLAYLFP